MMQGDRRRNPRLPIRLQVAHRPAGALNTAFRQDFTTDVAAGGTRFILVGGAPEVGSRLELELSIPPGEGHFPYAGKIRGAATILRCEPASADAPGRWAVAARFDEPLELDFA